MVIVVVEGERPGARFLDRHDELAAAHARQRLEARVHAIDHAGIAKRSHAFLDLVQARRRARVGHQLAREPCGVRHPGRRAEAHLSDRALHREVFRLALLRRGGTEHHAGGGEAAIGVKLREACRERAQVSGAHVLPDVFARDGFDRLAGQRGGVDDPHGMEREAHAQQLALGLGGLGYRRQRQGEGPLDREAEHESRCRPRAWRHGRARAWNPRREAAAGPQATACGPGTVRKPVTNPSRIGRSSSG